MEAGGHPNGTNFWETDDYKGAGQRNLNAALIAFSSAFLTIRLYVRLFMTKSPSWDDAFAVLAWACLVVQSTMDIVAVNYGSGAHLMLIPPALILKFFESLTTQNLIYFWSVGFMRLAIVAFLPRLDKDRNFLYILYATAGVILVQTMTCFFYKLFECTPVGDTWKPPGTPGLNCVSTGANEAMMTAHAIIGIITDLVLMALPIWVIYSKMIFSRKKFQVLLVFSVGVFVVVTGIVRLYYMKTLDFAVDSTYKMTTIGLWTDLEGHVGLWCGCFPALQPVLRIASYRLGLRSSPMSYGDRPTGQSGQPISGHMSGAADSRARSGHRYLRSGSGVDLDGLDSDTDSQKGMVKRHGEAGGDVELARMSEIRKETEVSVQVEINNQATPKEGGRRESWVDVLDSSGRHGETVGKGSPGRCQ